MSSSGRCAQQNGVASILALVLATANRIFDRRRSIVWAVRCALYWLLVLAIQVSPRIWLNLRGAMCVRPGGWVDAPSVVQNQSVVLSFPEGLEQELREFNVRSIFK
ncbi:hypothetical protein BJ878DRAFT_476074 [Calycina marina]|uniref:Uncharacterized protein n=1 Tax=Calycina marina TaxID=1763456 RepID=A0A9P8CKR3_9HELO|nr:hypothetical protein BJ878DRAFT_476074 [Calycina marina]